jgi:hypothetical protein
MEKKNLQNERIVIKENKDNNLKFRDGINIKQNNLNTDNIVKVTRNNLTESNHTKNDEESIEYFTE